VIDVSDIEHPKSVAYYEPKDGGTHNVWVAGDTLYLGDYQGGLRVLDISGELRGDLLTQGREIAHVVTETRQGTSPTRRTPGERYTATATSMFRTSIRDCGLCGWIRNRS
jgi:hypothetical protein